MNELPVQPITYIRKLLPDLSPLHRWMHGQFKNFVRDFVNRWGESAEMQAILARKLGEPGWVNPEIGILWNEFGELIEKEKILWDIKDDTTASGEQINRNERFWRNLRIIVCMTLDEDSYYVLRLFYMVELIVRDYKLYNIEEVHRHKAYWNWEEVRLKIQEEAKKKQMQREGWRTS